MVILVGGFPSPFSRGWRVCPDGARAVLAMPILGLAHLVRRIGAVFSINSIVIQPASTFEHWPELPV